jgi:TonB family protein
MLHSKRRQSFTNSRRLALLLIVLLVLPFCETTNHAEETVVVTTDWHPTEAHPIYLIAAPPQEKMGPRPLNVPVLPARRNPENNPNPTDLKLPFAMTAAQEVRIGNGLIDDADFQTALVYFEDAKKQDANSVDVLIGLARVYYELKREDEALALYKDALAQNPALWPAHFYTGRIHLENGRYPQAVEALNEALKLKSDDTETISSYGLALSKAGNSTAAIPYLKRILRPYVKEDFYYLGEAYANEHDWTNAADAFKKGADFRSIDPNGYFYWATMLFNADKLDEAFAGYQKVKELDITGSQSGASRYMAEIFRLRGKAADALSQYQLVLRKEPNDVETLFQAGYLSFKLNQLGQAKDLFRRLMEVDPKHAGGAANWAALEAQYNEIHQGRNEKTPGITLRDVVQANPNSLEAHTNLGAQLITEGVYEQAVPVLERAVSLRPESAAAQYNLGLAQVKTGKYEAAVASIRKAVELKPNWPDAYNNLGLAYGGLNRWEEAAQAHREAIRLVHDGGANYTGAMYNLGFASLKLGQKTVVQQLVEQLKPLNWQWQARLARELLASEGIIIASSAPAPAAPPAATPSAVPAATPAAVEPSPPVASDKSEGKSGPTPNATPNSECPSPIYRPADVTQMASLTEPVRVPYTADAIQNQVEGKIVLQVVLCANGRVSDITVKEPLPFGLTERAIEAMRNVQFQPATLDSRPVTVMITQTFSCAQQVCTAASLSSARSDQ